MISPKILPNGRIIKERIGVFGLPKVGKTHLFFMIAKWHQDMGSDAKFYGVNTDTSWDILSTNEDFINLTNIEWVDASNFQEFMSSVRDYGKVLRDPTPDFPGDWLCTDLQDDAWNYAQDEYAQKQATDEKDVDDMADLWLDATGNKYPIEGWDWGSINARYRTLANNYLLRGKGHRFIISGQQDVVTPSGNMDEKDDMRKLREMFSHLGVRPAGQKGDAFRWHSVLHISSRGERQQNIVTAGERAGYRRHMGKRMSNGKSVKPEVLEDFFMDYLIGVAGWSM